MVPKILCCPLQHQQCQGPARRFSLRRIHGSMTELAMHQCLVNEVEDEKHLLLETAHLQELEEAAAFREHTTFKMSVSLLSLLHYVRFKFLCYTTSGTQSQY